MRIDVHHHVIPPRYVAAREKHGIRTGPGFEQAMRWTPSYSLEAMNEHAIDTAIVSNPSNWMAFPPAEVASLARDSNEFAADMRRDHPGRFGFFASLPMPDVEASLREIEYAFDTLDADGISTTTSYADKWPSDESFDAVFAELDRRGAIVFVHPQIGGSLANLVPPVPDAVIEFMFDIVRCITSMLFRGTFTRFPRIRFIFTHGGGGLPALAQRIDRSTRYQKAVAERMPDGALAIIRRLYFDITSTTSPAAVAAMRELMLPGQLLFGTDAPFMTPEITVAGLERSSFAAEERAAIEYDNAAKLFPRFAETDR